MFLVVEILDIETNVSNPALATSCLIYRFLQTSTVIEMYEITMRIIMEEKKLVTEVMIYSWIS